MTNRTLLLLMCLLAVSIWLAAYCSLPGPRTTTLTEAPTPTRVPMTVLPSQTPYQFPSMVPTPSVTARELLPMAPTSTRQPSATPTSTVAPTMTPTR